MDRQSKTIPEMRRHWDACGKYLDALEQGYCTPEKLNTLLDAAMQQVELCCIEMRLLCERTRSKTPPLRLGSPCYLHKEVAGSVMRLDNGWLDIQMNALLPHCKIVGGTQYVTDTVTRLLNNFKANGGNIPLFEKAFVAIVEHCPENAAGAYDHDNKGFKAVINALKGRLFRDDDQFELSLGLFSRIDDDPCCHIYVTPAEEAGDLLYQLGSELF